MARNPFNIKNYPYLYNVKSVIKFNKPVQKKGKAFYVDRYTLSYKTMYGFDYPKSDSAVLAIAKENILKKFAKSGGKLISIEIINYYH
jgi:hypothetical protein